MRISDWSSDVCSSDLILSGAKAPQLQQPTSFYYPRLPQIAFYEAEDFPWLAEMLTALPAIRAEAEAVLAGESGVTPYVQRAKDRPEPTQDRKSTRLHSSH